MLSVWVAAPEHAVAPGDGVRGDDGEPAHQPRPPRLDEVAGDAHQVGHQLGRGQPRHQAVREPGVVIRALNEPLLSHSVRRRHNEC